MDGQLEAVAVADAGARAVRDRRPAAVPVGDRDAGQVAGGGARWSPAPCGALPGRRGARRRRGTPRDRRPGGRRRRGAGCGADAGGAALAHPATAAAVRTRTRTAIRFMSVGRGGRRTGSWFTRGAAGKGQRHDPRDGRRAGGLPLMELLADAGAETTAMVRVEARASICRGPRGNWWRRWRTRRRRRSCASSTGSSC